MFRISYTNTLMTYTWLVLNILLLQSIEQPKGIMGSSYRKKLKYLGLNMVKRTLQSFIKASYKESSIIELICFAFNDAILTTPYQIQDAFYSFYSDLFCSKMGNKRNINLGIAQFGPRLNQSQQNLLNLSFSVAEIKDAIWSIPDGKAPRLDGFNSNILGDCGS